MCYLSTYTLYLTIGAMNLYIKSLSLPKAHKAYQCLPFAEHQYHGVEVVCILLQGAVFIMLGD